MKITAEASVVLFNTEVASQRGIQGSVTEYVFARTPPMSTYLVGIVVGELEASRSVVAVACEAGGKDGGLCELPVTVYHRIGFGKYVDLAKNAAAAAVRGTRHAHAEQHCCPHHCRIVLWCGLPPVITGCSNPPRVAKQQQQECTARGKRQSNSCRCMCLA
jgi:hypothetical protein